MELREGAVGMECEKERAGRREGPRRIGLGQGKEEGEDGNRKKFKRK